MQSIARKLLNLSSTHDYEMKYKINQQLGEKIARERKRRDLTQEELAEKVGTTKSYISKLENNIKEVRISTLQKIVGVGLGGHLELSIKL